MRKLTFLFGLIITTSVALKAQDQTKTYLSFTNDSIFIYESSAIRYYDLITSTGNNQPKFIQSKDYSLICGYSLDSSLFVIRTEDDRVIGKTTIPFYPTYIEFSNNNEYIYYSKFKKLYRFSIKDFAISDSFEVITGTDKVYLRPPFKIINDSLCTFSSYTNTYVYNINRRTITDTLKVKITSKCTIHDSLLYFYNKDTLKEVNLNTLQLDSIYLASSTIKSAGIPFMVYDNFIYFMGEKNSPNSVSFQIERFDILNKKFIDSKGIGYFNNANISPDGNIWMTDPTSNMVTIYSTKYNKKIGQLTFKSRPAFIGFGKGTIIRASINYTSNNTAIKLYPNPATNKITLETGLNEVKNYTIINSLGKTVMGFKSNGTKTEVDVSNLTPGVYFVIPNGDKTKAIKFIKQ